MTRRGWAIHLALTTLLGCAAVPRVDAADPAVFTIQEQAGRLQIALGERPLAAYVYRDNKILRPHFANLFTSTGIQATRHHPPRAGVDATDHADMHPGVWLAFGDLGGGDFWRNKGRVEHVGFVEKPRGDGREVRWAVRNRYVAGTRTVCEEVCRHAIAQRATGWLLTYDSEFGSESPFAFGDQEEMGLGVRVATPLTVKNGGRILDSEGHVNEKQVRGKHTAWCDYSGSIDGRRVGVLIMPHPQNFRPSWYHARDYGFVAANPFGQNALTRGPKSRVEVKPGETLRLRFGVLVYDVASDAAIDRAGEYAAYCGPSR